jgi:hypothetical protein
MGVISIPSNTPNLAQLGFTSSKGISSALLLLLLLFSQAISQYMAILVNYASPARPRPSRPRPAPPGPAPPLIAPSCPSLPSPLAPSKVECLGKRTAD